MIKVHSLRLKKQTKALIEDLGVEFVVHAMDRSEAMLARSHSTRAADMDRFICVNGVAALEAHASSPFVTSELARINGFSLDSTTSKEVHVGEVGDTLVDLCLQLPQLILELRRDHKKEKADVNDIKRLISTMEHTLIALKWAVFVQTR